jgi:hypothetical protein
MRFLIKTFLFFSIINCSYASIIIQNGLTHDFNISKNGIKEGKVLLKNIGTKPEAIKVYFNDLSSDCLGKVEYLNPGTLKTSLYPFTNVNTGNYTLQPGEEYELLYKVNLEKNNIEEGSMWVLLMIEIVEPFTNKKNSQGIEIGSKVRYAIQLIGNIGAKTVDGIKFSNVALAKNVDLQKVINASLENNGKFLIIPTVNIQIFNEKGEKLKDVAVPSKKIYPKNCQKFTLDIADLPKGKYQAILLSEYLEESIGVNLDIEI